MFDWLILSRSKRLSFESFSSWLLDTSEAMAGIHAMVDVPGCMWGTVSGVIDCWISGPGFWFRVFEGELQIFL